MYKENKQTTIFADPNVFTGAKIDPENRWVKIAKMVPWEMIEKKYATNFKVKGTGRPAKPARYALASHLIKEKYGLSDEETVEMIRENPYLQFLLGRDGFTNKRPFDASTMVWFRKRMTPEMIAEVNEHIIAADREGDDTNGGGPGDTDCAESSDAAADNAENNGTLILDATCCPVDMRFPTDVSLLDEARKRLEEIIDKQYEALGKTPDKPRTYRRKARKEYLRFARARKRSVKMIRGQIKKQINFVRRDIGHVDKLGLRLLSEKDRAVLAVIRELLSQQTEMYESRTHSVPDRIVSIWRPYVRPIKRGKETADTEFGPKVTVSMIDGDARLEHLSWDSYNEAKTLEDAAERFRARTGRYPERILADKIFRTRENLAYCKGNGIRMNGPTLGRPPLDKRLYREQCMLERSEAGERNAIEGEFGVAKRAYSLDKIMMRLKETSELQIHLTFLSMNIWRRVRRSSILFFAFVKITVFGDFGVLRYSFMRQRRNPALAW